MSWSLVAFLLPCLIVCDLNLVARSQDNDVLKPFPPQITVDSAGLEATVGRIVEEKLTPVLHEFIQQVDKMKEISPPDIKTQLKSVGLRLSQMESRLEEMQGKLEDVLSDNATSHQTAPIWIAGIEHELRATNEHLQQAMTHFKEIEMSSSSASKATVEALKEQEELVVQLMDHFLNLGQDCAGSKSGPPSISAHDITRHVDAVCKERNKNLEAAPSDCAEVQKAGHNVSGIYTIHPRTCKGGYNIKVLCDLETDGGGWTVIQRRGDVSPEQQLDFFGTWNDYRWGFGELRSEFWIGLETIHLITSGESQSMRVDLEDFGGERKHALYRNFRLADNDDNFRLHVSGYSGNAGDSLSYHSEMPFSTKDRDNDVYHTGSCARLYRGAWWYRSCHKVNLNGLYLRGEHITYADGINWKDWHGYHYSLKASKMMVRPTGFLARD